METTSSTSAGPTSPHQAALTTPTPATRPSPTRAPASTPNFSSLPPLNTTTPSRTSSTQRPSYVNKRLSTFSSNSRENNSSRSRPQSSAFPLFLSSLPYALVRDFAYPTYHQLHYGAPPESSSRSSTPVGQFDRRGSDPSAAMTIPKGHWPSDSNRSGEVYSTIPLSSRSDGPPYDEDDDLLSPVVTSSRHKKSRSTAGDYDFARGRNGDLQALDSKGAFAGANRDGSETYYLTQGDELANGPGGEYVTVPRTQTSTWQYPSQMSYFPDGVMHYVTAEDDLSPSQPPYNVEDDDESRYSRNYQFTIVSPDEEMHGKAVALFDFERENDNELPFWEGQILWVSYRHGEGWLVAQDPKSGETGLIPEEYVRLLRDIEGGLNGLKSQGFDEHKVDYEDVETPTATTRPELGRRSSSNNSGKSGNGEHYAPVQSHFTTSSKDLHPYSQSHYLGSQVTTPIATSDGGQDDGGVMLGSETFQRQESPNAKLKAYQRSEELQGSYASETTLNEESSPASGN